MLSSFSKFSTRSASVLSSLFSSLSLPIQRPLRSWFLLFMLLNIADLITTFILFHARLVNGNPLAVFLLHNVGLFPILLIKIILISLASLGVGNMARRSPASPDAALNLLIICIGIVLLSLSLTLTQCALV